MVSVVSDKCVKCLACVEVCPVDAFREGEKMVVVSPDDCIDCGVCIGECSQGAITTEGEADAEWIKFNADNAATWPQAKK
jgi:ferredoxin